MTKIYDFQIDIAEHWTLDVNQRQNITFFMFIH